MAIPLVFSSACTWKLIFKEDYNGVSDKLIRMAKRKITLTPNTGRNAEKLDKSYSVGGNVNSIATVEEY